MEEIRTARLVLRQLRESDHGVLFELLSQLENDEFEGYPGITRESCGEHLLARLGSEEYLAVELAAEGRAMRQYLLRASPV